MDRFLTILALGVVAFWPFLSFLNHNKREILDPGPILQYGVLFVGAALAGLAIGRMMFRRQPLARLAIPLAAAVVALFSYGNLDIVAKELGVNRARYILAAWAALSLIAVGLAWRVSAWKEAGKVAAAVAVAMIALPAAQYAAFATLDRGAFRGEHVAVAPAQKAPATLPSVYFVILDGYGRADALLEGFQHDNRPFLDALRERDFFVAQKSRANYPVTTLSVSATLQMAYHPSGKNVAADMAPYQYKLSGFNRTVQKFRNLGYSYVHGQAGGWIGMACGGIENLCVKGERLKSALTEIELELLRSTPGLIFLQALYPDLVQFNSLTLPGMQKALAGFAAKPRFVLVHILAVHDYAYHSDCSPRAGGLAELQQSVGENEITAYRDTIVCVNRQVLSFVDAVIQDDPQSIVVLQSDHGPAIGDIFKKAFSDWSERDFRYRYGILNAFKLPVACENQLYESISPVNTFRLVFACIEGKRAELLPDRLFYANYYGKDVEKIVDR